MDCLFCKIIAGEIPSAKVYSDDHVYAFRISTPRLRFIFLLCRVSILRRLMR